MIKTVRGALLFEDYSVGPVRTITARCSNYTDACCKRKDVLRREDGLPTLSLVHNPGTAKSALTEPDERDADADDKHSGPAAGSHAFPQKEFSAERPGRVVQRGHRDDEADVFDGQDG